MAILTMTESLIVFSPLVDVVLVSGMQQLEPWYGIVKMNLSAKHWNFSQLTLTPDTLQMP